MQSRQKETKNKALSDGRLHLESHLFVQYRADNQLCNKKNLHSVVDTNQKLLLISSRKTREATDHGKWAPLSPSTAHQTQLKYLSKDHLS